MHDYRQETTTLDLGVRLTKPKPRASHKIWISSAAPWVASYEPSHSTHKSVSNICPLSTAYQDHHSWKIPAARTKLGLCQNQELIACCPNWPLSLQFGRLCSLQSFEYFEASLCMETYTLWNYDVIKMAVFLKG